MAFFSILGNTGTSDTRRTRLTVSDLNLNQVFDRAADGNESLAPYFYSPLTSEEDVAYRLSVFDDLNDGALRGALEDFSSRMNALAKDAEKFKRAAEADIDNALHRGAFLKAAADYISCVDGLLRALSTARPVSAGLNGLKEYLSIYASSAELSSIRQDAADVKQKLSSVRYCMNISGNMIRVKKYEGEAELSPRIDALFARFQTGESGDFIREYSERPYSENVEARVLGLVEKMYKKQFAALSEFCLKHIDFIDGTLRRFSEEVRFYLAWMAFTDGFKGRGLFFCRPKISGRISLHNGFDLALALKQSEVVTNSVELKGEERIIVVTGPNQGGKSTFARTFGQLVYLSSLGLTVPGEEAECFVTDGLYTHFDREEEGDVIGKLKSDLLSMKSFFETATERSVVILNEIFSSTATADAEAIAKKILTRIEDIGCTCLFVTFLDEMADFSAHTVSMVSIVDPSDPSLRTFKIVRKAADGLAYAVHIAKKYRLTRADIEERLK